jgi:hypothetical protein
MNLFVTIKLSSDLHQRIVLSNSREASKTNVNSLWFNLTREGRMYLLAEYP